jgi:hypothetical protein
MTQSEKGSALVTGASAGIGAEYALQLANKGYNIILVARDRDRLSALASDLTTKTRKNFEVVVADLSTEQGIATIERVFADDASITMLVNNAGIGTLTPELETGPAVTQAMLTLNVIAVARLTHAAATAFAKRGKGTIVQLSSALALKPEWVTGAYGASKAFVLTYSQSLKDELAKKGVVLQVVLPGKTRTAFWGENAAFPEGITMSPPDLVRAALSGLEQNEFITIPSLPDKSAWTAFETARNAMAPGLSRNTPATRYRVTA